jgi:cell division inhibitor SepF
MRYEFGLWRANLSARVFPPLREKNPDTMAISDTWHRALVYFGLAEERDEYVDSPIDNELEPEAEIEDRYRERPNVRRLQRRRRDEFDDIFADDSPREPARETRVLRSVSNGSGDLQVHLVVPKNFNDAQQIADRYKETVPVILNLQGSDPDLSKRLIDFSSGLTYALDGGMQRIADKVFLLTPRNVDVSAEERARLVEKGFFNQS